MGVCIPKHQEKIRRFQSEVLGDSGKDNHKGIISEEKEITEPKKKINRLCWTIELHDKFMNAVDTLGEVYADEDVIQKCSSIVVHRVPRPSIPLCPSNQIQGPLCPIQSSQDFPKKCKCKMLCLQIQLMGIPRPRLQSRMVLSLMWATKGTWQEECLLDGVLVGAPIWSQRYLHQATFVGDAKYPETPTWLWHLLEIKLTWKIKGR